MTDTASVMSKKNGDPKEILKKILDDEEEKKKKRRFAEDPIVKRYTETGYQNLKTSDEEDARRKKDEQDDLRRKRYETGSDMKPGSYDYGYVPNFKTKPIGDDDYKKNKRDVGGILDEMFADKKDNMPFGNVQYNDNARHIQLGDRHRHRHHREEKYRKKEQKQAKRSTEPTLASGKTDGKFLSLKIVISKTSVHDV